MQFCRKDGHNRSTCKEAPQSSNYHPRRLKKNMTSTIMSQTSSNPTPLTQSTPTPPLHTQQSSSCQPQQPSQPSNSSIKRSCIYKSRLSCGMGLIIDEVTGRTVYNPGLSSEMTIEEGSNVACYTEHPKKFPIPNERIQFKDYETLSQPPTLPVKPLGLIWKGNPSITSSQLQHQVQRKKTKCQMKSTKSNT